MKDAKVSVANNATGDVRERRLGQRRQRHHSGAVADRNLHGQRVKAGFGNEERKDITLRSGETATLKVTLLVGSEKAEVTVFGTTEGVRADPQIGRRLDSPRIDETPILGRKVDDAAAPQLGVPAGEGHGRSLRQRDLLHHRRRFTPRDHVHARRREQR